LTPGCAPHPPIRITEEHGEEDFTWTNPVTGETEDRPGSGVVAGNGTEEDPYVIEGWCIQTPPGGDAVRITGTDVHVRVSTNVLTGVYDPHNLDAINNAGVRLKGTSNVTVSSNTIASTIVGVFLDGSRDTTIADNVIVRVRGDGIVIWDYREPNLIANNNIANNTILGSFWYGIFLQSSEGNILRGNTLYRNWKGIDVSSSPRTEILENTIRDNHATVLDLAGSFSKIRRNLVEENGDGVAVHMGHSEIRNNTIAGNDGDGILLEWGGRQPYGGRQRNRAQRGERDPIGGDIVADSRQRFPGERRGGGCGGWARRRERDGPRRRDAELVGGRIGAERRYR
jgi:parallel beta-helix repeat protein